MDRRGFVVTLLGAAFSATMAAAAGYADAVVAQLRAQGYGQITVERTLLGRTRIVAMLGESRREIILNPRTGEILRDVVTDETGAVLPQIARGSEGSSGKGSSSGSDDSGDDDSGGDDSGGDDHGGGSGNSGSNSGSGSSGSGKSGGSSGHGGSGSDHSGKDDGGDDD